MGCSQGGRALGNHRKLKTNEKRREVSWKAVCLFWQPYLMLLLLSHHHFLTGVSSLFWWKHAALLAAALPSLRVLLGRVQTPPGSGTMAGSLYRWPAGSLSCTGLFPVGSEVCFEQLSVCRLKLVLSLLPKNWNQGQAKEMLGWEVSWNFEIV